MLAVLPASTSWSGPQATSGQQDSIFMAGSPGGHSDPAVPAAGLALGAQDAEKPLPSVHRHCFHGPSGCGVMGVCVE